MDVSCNIVHLIHCYPGTMAVHVYSTLLKLMYIGYSLAIRHSFTVTVTVVVVVRDTLEYLQNKCGYNYYKGWGSLIVANLGGTSKLFLEELTSL